MSNQDSFMLGNNGGMAAQRVSAERDYYNISRDLFVKREAIIGIVGLGYVGLPLCLTAMRAGYRVVGIDIDSEKISSLKAGISYINPIQNDSIKEFIDSGIFSPATQFERLRDADAIIICVPTPMTAQREPDLSYIIQTAKQIAPRLRRGHLVVLESTTWPGTTVEIVKPILETSNLRCGSDIFLAFSPEREDPGNEKYSTGTIPKVVGGNDEKSLALACSMYERIISHIVPVSSAATAEAVKLTENIFRSVNVALVNELKLIYDKMGIDVWEVINAAKTKPFGYMPFYPGPGLGGHCLPIDPFYLSWKAREFDINAHFIELAGQINTAMPSYVVQRLSEALDVRFRRGLAGTPILLVGLAYKKNVSDIRESPSLRLLTLLRGRAADVEYYDPFVDVIPATREHMEFAGQKSIEWSAENLRRFAAAIIVTDHDSIQYDLLVELCPLVVDTRNACGSRNILSPSIVKA